MVPLDVRSNAGLRCRSPDLHACITWENILRLIAKHPWDRVKYDVHHSVAAFHASLNSHVGVRHRGRRTGNAGRCQQSRGLLAELPIHPSSPQTPLAAAPPTRLEGKHALE